MKVKDKVKVTGRGCVIIVEPDCEIDISDKIECNGVQFGISGIERWSHMKTTGLILRPNSDVYDAINIGDDLDIVKH